MSAVSNVGIWLVGARGAVATCVAIGIAGWRRELLPPTGLVTELEEFGRLDLVAPERFVLGGHDMRCGSVLAAARELARCGIVAQDVVEACASDLGAYDERIRTGYAAPGEAATFGGEEQDETRSLRERWQAVRDDLATFAEREHCERVIVVHLGSAERSCSLVAELATPEALERAIDAGADVPASVLYAYAALDLGFGYVNFTSNLGSSVPALRTLATHRGAVHAGRDGKTGETLVRTALAPMFVKRNLNVLAWQGYNMLGNRDGQVLRDPEHKAAKLTNKSGALQSILGPGERHLGTGIDFVPSLGDWKTAWDFIHFEGFLGAKMSMQFTWQGSDSSLAAPLVIDLCRLVERAQRAGLTGVLDGLACFFKSPMDVEDQDFFAQHERLLNWVRTRL
ncbi:MAG: inositol-3-phosphate synthase [Planctomycetes bacterium]|nr:inositol-3-phosphate synthase [Planctomycetota bacterium]